MAKLWVDPQFDMHRLLDVIQDRYALSIRVDPAIMLGAPQDAGKPMPFGVFFSHGRHFNAFHCRFRDIARGVSKAI